MIISFTKNSLKYSRHLLLVVETKCHLIVISSQSSVFYQIFSFAGHKKWIIRAWKRVHEKTGCHKYHEILRAKSEILIRRSTFRQYPLRCVSVFISVVSTYKIKLMFCFSYKISTVINNTWCSGQGEELRLCLTSSGVSFSILYFHHCLLVFDAPNLVLWLLTNIIMLTCVSAIWTIMETRGTSKLSSFVIFNVIVIVTIQEPQH
jgi:hypothetical protein